MTAGFASFQNFSGYVEINGQKQFLSVRSAAKDLPLLLYLHGGPGDAALPLVAKYNRSLEKFFTVAVWEQRGTGKSYYPFPERKGFADDGITISAFVEDIASISRFLLHRYGQRKLYLVGHSWGSVLGLEFIKRYPEMVSVYTGCGQVVNMKKSSRLAYEYALRAAAGEGDAKALERLKRIDCAYASETWMEDLLFVTGQVVKYGGSLFGHKNYAPYIRDFLLSREYTLKDLINRQKGAAQSIRRLWPELMTVDFEENTEFSVPVIFVEGSHDQHVSSALAKAYFDTIQSPKQFFLFTNSCHFPQWSEAERFTEVMRSASSSSFVAFRQG